MRKFFFSGLPLHSGNISTYVVAYLAFTEGQFSWWHTVLSWRALSDLYWFFSCSVVSHRTLKLVINKIIIKYIMSPEVETYRMENALI